MVNLIIKISEIDAGIVKVEDRLVAIGEENPTELEKKAAEVIREHLRKDAERWVFEEVGKDPNAYRDEMMKLLRGMDWGNTDAKRVADAALKPVRTMMAESSDNIPYLNAMVAPTDDIAVFNERKCRTAATLAISEFKLGKLKPKRTKKNG